MWCSWQFTTLALILSIFGLAGCDPYPDCVYSPFGCGFFSYDAKAALAPLQSVTPAQAGQALHYQALEKRRRVGVRTKNFSGVWNVSLQAVGGTCPAVPQTLAGLALVKQNGRRISLMVPHYGVYHGRAGGARFKAGGVYQSTVYPCSAAVMVDFLRLRGNAAQVAGAAVIECYSQFHCTVDFRGRAERQGK